MPHADYRSDLDGLRAVAVLSVLFFHAGITAFSGGFVGVDIFFVLSGYFMAKIILRDLDNGRFDFSQFYMRRMRRIFPALFAMIIVTSVVASFLFMPREFRYFADSVRAAAVFVANLQFQEESGYFDLAAEMKPLLHTWSLSVEEQFYLAFPLGLYLVHRFNRHRVLHLILAVLAISFVASVWEVWHDAQKAFYFLPFRVWELLVGAAVAAAPRPAWSIGGSRVLEWGGISAVLLSIFLYDASLPFPGAYALLPCLGAAALIMVGGDGGVSGRLLRNRPMVFIGQVSYSLYLWHWPVIVFARYLTQGDLTPAHTAGVILLSFVLAVLSWRFVEQPFRFGRLAWRRPAVFGASAAFVVAAIGFGTIVNHYNGMPARLPQAARTLYQATYDIGPYNSPDCFADSDGDGLTVEEIKSEKLCSLGRGGDQKPAFILWGDSHAAAIAPALDQAARQAGVSGLFVGRASCPPLPGADFAADPRAVARCRANLAATVALIEKERFPLVFLAGYWPKYVHHSELPGQGVFFDPSVAPDLPDHSAQVVSSLEAMINRFKEKGSRTALIMDVPEVGYAVPEALARAQIVGKSLEIAPSLDYTQKRQALARAVLSDVARTTGSFLVDPMDTLCDANRCKVMIGQTVLYKDGDHLSESGAALLAPLFLDSLMTLRQTMSPPASSPVTNRSKQEEAFREPS